MTEERSNSPDPDPTQTTPDRTESLSDPRPGAFPAAVLPKKIGQFHIKEVIATGGMGTVYRAMQERPRRIVALKVMKHGVTSRSAFRRFEYESQILARLGHPGIAQVYDAGTHDDGTGAVPFFAMEYIPNAKSITEYAKAKELSLRARLALFARVCDAAHHGHQKGIIHRDLKPGNILVDANGEAKIIDFGVARGTDSDMAVTTLQTDLGQLIGTLRYMSPEQCAGDPQGIDIRSDVYSLGVVLNELLTGRLPYDVLDVSIPHLARLIQEGQPVRLSASDATLKGDLETIVAKALEKDRERRYQSAFELAQDVRRYLAGEAITARAPSLFYQVQTFARHNRALCGAIAAVFLALITGIGVSSGQAVRATRAERLAQREAATARAVIDFLKDNFLSVVAPGEQGPDVTVREAVNVASTKLAQEFAEEPLVEAEIRQALAETYWALGDYGGGVRHAEKALDFYRTASGPEDAHTLDCMNTLAVLYKYQSRYEEAESLYVKTLEGRRRVLGREHVDTLETMDNLATLLTAQGRLDEAEPLYREVQATHQRILGADHLQTLFTTTNLANLLYAKGELVEAESLLRQAMEGRRRVLPPDHPDMLQSNYSLATILSKRGEYVEAERLFRQTLENALRVFGEEHDRVGSILKGLGVSLLGQGDREAAEPALRQALEIGRRLQGAEYWLTAETQSGLGESLTRPGRYEEAERELLAAHRALAASGGKLHWRTVRTIKRLVHLYESWDKPAEAEAWRSRLRTEEEPVSSAGEDE